jgi:hypothetical protein
LCSSLLTIPRPDLAMVGRNIKMLLSSYLFLSGVLAANALELGLRGAVEAGDFSCSVSGAGGEETCDVRPSVTVRPALMSHRSLSLLLADS